MNAYENAAPAGVSGLGALTVEGWIKPSDCGNPTNRRIIDHKSSGTNEGWYVDFVANGGAGVLRGRVGELQVTGTTSSPIEVLTHFAMTYDGLRLVVYRNGIEDARDVQATTVPVQSPAIPITIGAATNASFRYCGLVDEVAIYGRALAPSEVLKIYAEGPSARCKN